MPFLTVYGSSDDLVEFGCDPKDSIKGTDEFNVNSDKINEWLLVGPDGSCRILAIYDGTWSFAIAKVAEDIPIPGWAAVTRDAEEFNSYSTLLTVVVPEGTYLYQKVGGRK